MRPDQRTALDELKRRVGWDDDRLDLLCLGHAAGTLSAPRGQVCDALDEARLDGAIAWLAGMAEMARRHRDD